MLALALVHVCCVQFHWVIARGTRGEIDTNQISVCIYVHVRFCACACVLVRLCTCALLVRLCTCACLCTCVLACLYLCFFACSCAWVRLCTCSCSCVLVRVLVCLIVCVLRMRAYFIFSLIHQHSIFSSTLLLVGFRALCRLSTSRGCTSASSKRTRCDTTSLLQRSPSVVCEVTITACCVPAYVGLCMHTCMRARVRASVRAGVFARASLHACLARLRKHLKKVLSLLAHVIYAC